LFLINLKMELIECVLIKTYFVPSFYALMYKLIPFCKDTVHVYYTSINFIMVRLHFLNG